MLFIKRFLCGFIALFLIILGILISNDSNVVWFVLGGATAVLGFALIYIAIMQSAPSYNFLITIVACFFAYSLFFYKYENKNPNPNTNTITTKTVEKQKEKPIKKKIIKKKKQGINLEAYPKISGQIEVIHAHLFRINNRYVRLYGVDAPDNDQLCSDERGGSYNCGEQAASWVRNWIDNNVVDCYIFKVDPNGVDLASCLWGHYDIGAGLVGAGWGIAKEKETSIYKPYEVKARSESSGLWQGTFYSPDDWRDIKRRRNDFTVKTRHISKDGGFFNFKSWF